MVVEINEEMCAWVFVENVNVIVSWVFFLSGHLSMLPIGESYDTMSVI